MKWFRRQYRTRRLVGIALIAFVFGSLYVFRTPLLTKAGRWLNVSSPITKPVDDVVVLGGNPGTRPFVAAAMVRSGYARQILIPQVVDSGDVIDGIIPPEHEIVRQVLLRSGVSGDAIAILPVVADSTDREARCVASYLAAHPQRTVAIVTSDFHTRRTRLLFMRACRNDASRLVVIGAPTDYFTAADWWRVEAGFIVYTNEFLKLAKVWISA